jgi:hypothetical protein
MLLLVGVISLILGSLGASATITTATSHAISSQNVQQLAATSSKDQQDDNDCDKGTASAANERTSDNDNADCEPGTSSRDHTHVKLECSRYNVNDDGGTCALEFTEESANGSPAANVKVCFSVSPVSAGFVTPPSPPCTTTDKNGEADATFHANDNQFGKVTITATTGDDTAKTTVKIVGGDNK